MLNKKIQLVKESYYDNNNVQDYLEKCELDLELPEQIENFCNENAIKLNEDENYVFPSKDWFISFDPYKKENFEIEYTSQLTLSKLTKVYSLLHSFEVKNKEPNYMEPFLSNSRDEPYTKMQFDFDNNVVHYLKEIGYDRLLENEGNRKLEGLKFNNDVVLFGPDVTVDDLLFRDVLGVTPED
ncbi:hypothetical protein [Carnobacterium maltaromaticum]|uniref:hypothetical protein n=1 Tax=Carnobacterium maltaromaticum TaxID=2751 RepID=UPI0039BE83D9